MKTICFFFSLFLLSGCETVVDLSADGEPVAVLNSLLCPDSSCVRIDLNYSAKVATDPLFPVERNARIELQENGEKVALARFDSVKNCYFAPYRVKYAHTYRVIAFLPSGEKVWGETRIPEPLEQASVTIDTTLGPTMGFTTCWQNISGRTQVYWIYGYAKYEEENSWVLPFSMGTTSPLPDPFNVEVDTDVSRFPFYFGYMRIESKQGIPRDFSITYYVSRNRWVWSHLICTDRNYDLYLKSYVKNQDMRADTEELPIYITPAYTHSNIEGGTGIVGSYCGIYNSL